MNREELILETAEHIERHPKLYCYTQGLVRRDPNWPMCMLARMGYLAGAPAFTNCFEVAHRLLRLSESEFYIEIDRGQYLCARVNPLGAVKGLRQLAPRYRGIPEDVRAIFEAPFVPRVVREMTHPVGLFLSVTL